MARKRSKRSYTSGFVRALGSAAAAVGTSRLPLHLKRLLEDAVFARPAKVPRFDTDHGVPYPGRPTRTMTDDDKKKKRHSSNMSGVYTGRIRRAKRVKPISNYRKEGSDFTMLGGNVVTGADGCSVGHTNAPAYNVLRSACRAVFAKCMRKAGNRFSDWNDNLPFGSTLRVEIIYRTAVHKAVVLVSTAPPAFNGFSYAQASTKLMEIILDQVVVGDDQFIWESIAVFNENGTADYFANMDLRACKLDIYMKSTIVLQNRTHPTDAVGDQTTDSVNANPLMFKKFEGTGDGFVTRVAGAFDTIGDAYTGVIDDMPGGTTIGLEAPDVYRNCRKTSHFVLNPGEIKKSVLYDRQVVSLNTVMRHLSKYIALATTAVPIVGSYYKFGHSAMFEAEKLCNTYAGNEPFLQVGYEVVTQICSRLICKAAPHSTPKLIEKVGAIVSRLPDA